MPLYEDETPVTEETEVPPGVSVIHEEEPAPVAQPQRRRRSTPKEAIAEKRREPKELPLVQIRLEYTGETQGTFIVLGDESAKREAAIDAIQRDAVEVFEGRIKRFKVVADE